MFGDLKNRNSRNFVYEYSIFLFGNGMRYRYKISYGYAVSLDIYELKLRTFFDTPEKEGELFCRFKKIGIHEILFTNICFFYLEME